MREVAVLGVGMHPFGKFRDKTFVDLGVFATRMALQDAGLRWKDIQGVAAGCFVWGGLSGMLPGHQIAATMGETGIPIVNVSNACATPASALRTAYQMVAYGSCDVALAVGSDKAPEGFLPSISVDESPTDIDVVRWKMVGAPNPAYFAIQARDRMERYGTTSTDLAMVKVKNSRHGQHNPYARFRKVYSMEEVLASPMVCDPLQLYMIASTSDGGGAVILSSMDVARRHTTRPVRLASAALASTKFGSSLMAHRPPLISFLAGLLDLSKTEVGVAAGRAYEESGLGPEDLDLVELGDGSTWHELFLSEVVGICKEGEAERLLREGATSIGGRIPVNTSGGLSSCGEAAATQALAMVAEVTWQLRGQAGPRQVENAKVGFCQLPGAMGNSGAVVLKV